MNESPNVALLRRISANAYTDAIEIVQLVEMVEMGNSGNINENLSDKDAGFAAMLIRQSLLTRLHIYVSRAYPPVRKGDLHLRRAFELLSDKSVHAAICLTGSPADLAEAEVLWNGCNKDPRLVPFQHLRNKFLAHLSEPNAAIDLPTFNDVFGISRSTAAVMEKLAHGTGVVSVPLVAQLSVPKRSMEAFWQPWR